MVNDTKQRSAAIDGLESISQLVRRYAEIEHIYLQGEELTLRNDLEAAITKLYSQVLEYEARAACHFNRNTAFQIVRNIVEADSWESILGKIKTSEIACGALKEIIDAKDQRARMRRLEDMLDKQAREVDRLLEVSRSQDEELLAEIKAMRKDQKASFQTQKEMDCHKSLRTTAYENTMEKNPDRVPGTCEWFLRNPRYCKWLDDTASDLLWVTVDPGCGKSVLSKFLINDYKSWMWKDMSICYFFFKDDSSENKSVLHALCAMLHQLFIQNHTLLKHAMTEYDSNGTQLPQLFGSLWSILLQAATDPNNGGIFCIIDALDECDESSCEELIRRLAEFHSNTSRMAKIKFLITSRPNAFITRVFSQYFSRHNQDLASVKLMGEDEPVMEEICTEIDLVIDAEVKGFKKRRSSYGIDDNADVAVQQQLKKNENRTYLWTALIFPELDKVIEYAEEALLEAIKRIPSTVDEAYERILSKSSDGEKARRLLHVVCAASRPLTLVEMNRALSIKENGCITALVPPQTFGNVVRNLCGLFISIQHARIYLIHQTAKEFLIRKNAIEEPISHVSYRSGIWKHSLEPTESNLVLAEICLRYLLFSVFESDRLVGDEIGLREFEQCVEECVNEHDFLDYSANHWATHFQKAKTKQMTILKLALENCNTRSKRFKIWFPVYWIATGLDPPRNFTDLTVGSYLGHEAVVKQLLERGVDPDFKDIDGRTPLSWAAEKGHKEVVKLLLAKDGVDPDSKDSKNQTPLSWAAEKGHKEVVELLLAKDGVDPDSKDSKNRTPLLWAAWNGHKEVVELLLAKDGVDPDSRDDGFGRTPLSWAAEWGHKEVVELLLAKDGVDPDSKDSNSRTPLSWAARNGYKEVVELLLAKDGVDPDSKDSNNRTPLSWAAENGYKEVVEMLLAKDGVDPDSIDDRFGRTPLSWAARNGYKEVVELLLAKDGVDPDSRDDRFGRTPLSWAARNGRKEVVELLLAKDGVDPDSRDDRLGRTPLSWAAEKGHKEVVELLLAKDGVDPDSRDDGFSRTPLSWAEQYGHEEIVKLL